MDETYTCSTWRVAPERGDEWIQAFHEFARGASSLGGAREGMILQDEDDPGHFIVIRRWDDAQAVGRWQGSPQQESAGKALREITPDAVEAYLTKRIASLGE